jgi:two-component system, OmpR family, phosphate regulon sensor histidine kinase PhoR
MRRVRKACIIITNMPVSDADKHDSNAAGLRDMLRYAGFVMPFMVFGLGMLTLLDILPRSPHYSDAWLIGSGVAFVLLGFWQFFTNPDGQNIKLATTHLVLYHILAVAFLLMVSGLSGPVVICWIVLLLASDLYFGRDAFILSALTLLTTWWLDIAFRDELELFYIGSSLATILLIVVAGFIATRLRVMNDLERAAFKKSRRKEVLQRDRMLALINGIGDAVISTDEHGVIKVYNAAALSLLDTNEMLVGKSLDTALNLYDESNKPVDLSDLLGNTRTNATRRDLSHKFDDGEYINLYINLAPIRANYQEKTSQGYILVMRDITKEKSLEEERDEFISVVSHELRTPVTIAEGNVSNVQMMLQKGAKHETLVSSLTNAHDQIMYLAKMINDLSTLSRAERGVADDPEDINVRQMLNDLYGEYHSHAEKKGLKFDLDTGARLSTVYTSRLYLEEMIQNLISNAIKYTTGGSIKLSAHQSGNSITFSVTDTGIGISKSDQKKIFGKFYRSEDYRTRETTGTGLGLYVVSKLARKIGARIEVKSRLNHGSTFSFALPVKDTK